MLIAFAFWCVVFASENDASAAAQSTLQQPDVVPVPLYRVAEEFDDPSGRYTLDAVRSLRMAAFRAASPPGIDLRYRWRWYRFHAPVFSHQDPRWFLLVDNATDVAELYTADRGAHGLQFGVQTPVGKRAGHSGLPMVQLPHAAKDAVFYLRTLGIDNFGPTLLPERLAQRHVVDLDLKGAFYIGVFGAFAITAFLFFLFTRDAAFFAYCSYMTVWAAENGMRAPFVWRSVFSTISFGFTWPYTAIATATFVASLIFARLFFDTKRKTPIGDAILLTLVAAVLLGIPASELLIERYGISDAPFTIGCVGAILGLGLALSYIRLRQGFSPAAVYGGGLLLGAAFVLMYFGTLYQFIPLNWFTTQGDSLGLMIDAVGFLSALAYRSVLTAREREAALIASDAASARAVAEKERRISQLKAHNVAVSRFVPHEFLDEMGRRDVTEVRLGDYVQRRMCVLFSDIRGFTPLAEKVTPEEAFAFVNSFFGFAGPIVRRHGGFIDKYIGDAIMALFSSSVDSAVAAAVSLQCEIARFNRNQGLDSLRAGVGLHYGELTLGTVGEVERYETTVVAEAVNIAARLEKLTKSTGTKILVSAAVIEALEHPRNFQYRPLGELPIEGLIHPVSVYEVLLTTGEVFSTPD